MFWKLAAARDSTQSAFARNLPHLYWQPTDRHENLSGLHLCLKDVPLENIAAPLALDVEIGFARKIRSPSYQERYIWIPLSATGGLADGRNYIGTPDLDPEVSYQTELGFDWQEDGFFFAPRFFYRYVKDYIQGTPSTNNAALAINN